MQSTAPISSHHSHIVRSMTWAGLLNQDTCHTGDCGISGIPSGGVLTSECHISCSSIFRKSYKRYYYDLFYHEHRIKACDSAVFFLPILGLLYRHWDNHEVAVVLVKDSWMVCVDRSVCGHDKTQQSETMSILVCNMSKNYNTYKLLVQRIQWA